MPRSLRTDSLSGHGKLPWKLIEWVLNVYTVGLLAGRYYWQLTWCSDAYRYVECRDAVISCHWSYSRSWVIKLIKIVPRGGVNLSIIRQTWKTAWNASCHGNPFLWCVYVRKSIDQLLLPSVLFYNYTAVFSAFLLLLLLLFLVLEADV